MKRLLHVLWLAPIFFLAFLWFEAGCDTRYLLRVLVHRDSKASDFKWKASATIPAASHPMPWRESPACPRVEAAFAAATGGTDMSTYLARGGALALVVVRDGAITCEWYGNGGAKDAPAAAFSISKTVTSLLLARAVAAGDIHSLDDPITRYAPALARRDARFARITLASLVDMRSGIAFDEETPFPWVNRDAPRVYYASDLAHAVIAQPVIEAPPGKFVYNDYAPNLIGLAFPRRATDGAVQALWQDIGAEYPAAWSVDGHGTPWLESGFVVTARDLARIGQLLLDDGMVANHRVAPAAWLARSLDPIGRATAVVYAGTPLGYRNAWWAFGDHALVGMGRHGQLLVVDLATRTVIVRMGTSDDETNVSIARRLLQVADMR